MLIQKWRNLCIFPKISLKILELFHFGPCVCFLNWETLLCQEWAKMERRRKECKRDGWKRRSGVASLCCPICILSCKNITSDLHYWNVFLPATQDLSPHSSLNCHLKIWIRYYFRFLNGFLLHLVLLLFSPSPVSDALWHHGLQHAGLPYHSLSLEACANSCPLSWWCHFQTLYHSLQAICSLTSQITLPSFHSAFETCQDFFHFRALALDFLLPESLFRLFCSLLAFQHLNISSKIPSQSPSLTNSSKGVLSQPSQLVLDCLFIHFLLALNAIYTYFH